MTQTGQKGEKMKFINAQEVASILGISRASVFNFVRSDIEIFIKSKESKNAKD